MGVKPYNLLTQQEREWLAQWWRAGSHTHKEKLTVTSMSSTWRWWVPRVPWSRVRASSKWAFNCRLSLYRTENWDCMQRYSGVSLTTSSTALRNSTLGRPKEKASQSQRKPSMSPSHTWEKYLKLTNAPHTWNHYSESSEIYTTTLRKLGPE